MSRPHYPWYPYVKNLLRGYMNMTARERDAVRAAMEAASPEAREIVQAVYVTRSKYLQGAAKDAFISYATARRKATAVIEDIARRLGLLE